MARAVPASAPDLDAVVGTLAAAFQGDPLWRWAFPDGAGIEPFWRFLVGSALRFPETWYAPGYAAASVWIPPGGEELTAAEEDALEPLLSRLAGDRAASILELLERFEEAHPRGTPHYYLSLLGTHPDHRGSGVGMALLAENLAAIDAQGLPAYLESSNPANDARYERVGFSPVGAFSTPDGSHRVTTMWREAR
jgi:GNAT superfamily N-acetyltransferase